jgi:hypothetical protein
MVEVRDAAPQVEPVLIKVLHHLVNKGRPDYSAGHIRGYTVPRREFERLRNKVYAMQAAGMYRVVCEDTPVTTQENARWEQSRM